MEGKLQQLIKTDKDRFDLAVFRKLFDQFQAEPSTIDWSRMRPLGAARQRDFDSLEADYRKTNEVEGEAFSRSLLGRLAVVKLNGGLGTTMRCAGTKSLIELRDGKTFLEFALRQNAKLNETYGAEVPLLLMNSFNTADETRVALAHFDPQLLAAARVSTFEQSRCPRIFADTQLPVPQSADDMPNEGWYPPGHGNIFQALHYNGLLDRLLAAGRDLLFVSNIDNTGACVSLPITAAMCSDVADYIMEVTQKTITDIKGGTVIEYNGSLMHLEMPQVPADHIDDFCSLNTFKIFNTNNIWVNLQAVSERLDRMKMEIIANKKMLSPAYGCWPVVQLETSVGGAIRNFERALCVCVGRHRFLPVKTTQDLLPLMSNAYHVDEADAVIRLVNPGRDRPTVKLDEKYFGAFADFRHRFTTVPDMHELKRLEVIGDVCFGENVKLLGNVTIEAVPGESRLISDCVLGD